MCSRCHSCVCVFMNLFIGVQLCVRDVNVCVRYVRACVCYGPRVSMCLF